MFLTRCYPLFAIVTIHCSTLNGGADHYLGQYFYERYLYVFSEIQIKELTRNQTSFYIEWYWNCTDTKLYLLACCSFKAGIMVCFIKCLSYVVLLSPISHSVGQIYSYYIYHLCSYMIKYPYGPQHNNHKYKQWNKHMPED